MSARVRPPPVLARFHRAFLTRSCLDALFGRSVWQIGNINLTSHRIRTKNSQKETVNGYIYRLHRGGQPTCEEYRAHSDTRMGVTRSLYSYKALDTAAGRGAECIGRSVVIQLCPNGRLLPLWPSPPPSQVNLKSISPLLSTITLGVIATADTGHRCCTRLLMR